MFITFHVVHFTAISWVAAIFCSLASIGWVQISAEGNQSSVRRWGLPLRVQLLLLYITIKSWTLSGNPQRYTEPPWPSAELCTVPFLSLASSSISRTWVGGHQTLFRFIINIALCRTSCPLRTVHSIQLNSNWTYMYRVTNKYQGTTTF